MDIKIKTALEKGYTCDLKTGKVFGPYGRECQGISNGYVKIYLNGIKRRLSAHRFIFYVGNGYLPDIIDHIDRNKLNNSLSNLRPADKSLNSKNREYKGYTYIKSRNRYKAQIGIGNRKNIHLGYFKTEEDANKAYLDAKKIYHKI